MVILSYETLAELPQGVRFTLSEEDQEVWRQSYREKIDELRSLKSELPEFIPSHEYMAREYAWEQCTALPSSRYVYAKVSTEVPDLQRDLLNMESLVKSAYSFIDLNGAGHTDHNSFPLLYWWGAHGGVDEDGVPSLYAKVNFARGSKQADYAWLKFLNGFDQWSVGFGHDGKPEMKCNEELCYLEKNVTEVLEISNTKKGVNPKTGTLEFNTGAKSIKSSVLKFNNKECVHRLRYEALKDRLSNDANYDTTILSNGMVYITDNCLSDYAIKAVKDIYEDNYYDGMNGEDGYILIVPKTEWNDSEILHTLIDRLIEEREAIQAYLLNMELIGKEANGYMHVYDVLNYIKEDEKEHVGKLLEAIASLDPQIAESLMENETGEKSLCPEGQHNHAGIEGCHAINRDHHEEKRVTPAGQMVLSGENIDIATIQNTDTQVLKNVLLQVGKILSESSEDEINEFLTTTPGKEFLLIFLELQKRKRKEGNKMTEEITEEVKTEVAEPSPDGEVKSVTDGTLLANLADAVAILLNQQKVLIEMMTEEKNARVMQSGAGQESAASAIADAVSSVTADESVAPPQGSAPVGEEKAEEGEGESDAPNSPEEGEKEESGPPAEVTDETETKEDESEEEKAPEEEPKAELEGESEKDEAAKSDDKKKDEAGTKSEEAQMVETTETQVEPEVKSEEAIAPTADTETTPVAEPVAEVKSVEANADIVVDSKPAEPKLQPDSWKNMDAYLTSLKSMAAQSPHIRSKEVGDVGAYTPRLEALLNGNWSNINVSGLKSMQATGVAMTPTPTGAENSGLKAMATDEKSYSDYINDFIKTGSTMSLDKAKKAIKEV